MNPRRNVRELRVGRSPRLSGPPWHLEQRLALTASYLFGIDDIDDIWQINPEPGEQSFADVRTTGLTPGVRSTSDAFAFDRDRDQMFFLNRSASGTTALLLNDLWTWNKPLDTIVQIAPGTVPTLGTVGGFTMIKRGTIDPTTEQVIGMQIACNGDYSILYGHNLNDGTWFSLDTATGDLADLNFATLVGDTNRGFRDIGGASIVTAVRADVAVTKTVVDATPNVGDTITHTVPVSNNGPDETTDVRVTDTFPASGLADIVAGTPTVGSYDPETRVWTVGALANGASATRTFTALVTEVGTFPNFATATSSTFDPNEGNDTGEAEVLVGPGGIILGTDSSCGSGRNMTGSHRADHDDFRPSAGNADLARSHHGHDRTIAAALPRELSSP